MEPSPSIDSVDDDILKGILKYALNRLPQSFGDTPRPSSQESSSIPLVCRRWRTVLRIFRRSLSFTGTAAPFTSRELQEWLQANPGVDRISIGAPSRELQSVGFPGYRTFVSAEQIHCWIPILASSARSLTSLHLELSEADSFTLPAELGYLTALTELSVLGEWSGPDFIHHVTRLTALTSFKGSSSSMFFDVDVPAALFQLPLKTLVLEVCNVPNLFAQLRGLESLTLRSCYSEHPPYTLGSLSSLSALTRLELTEHWYNDLQLHTLMGLSCQETLKELLLGSDHAFGDLELSQFGPPPFFLECSLPSLQSVDIRLSPGVAKKLLEAAKLASLPSLQTLKLAVAANWEVNLGVEDVLEEVLEALGEKKSALKALKVMGYKHFPSTAEFWMSFPNLEEIVLHQCDGFSQSMFLSFPALKRVTLEICTGTSLEAFVGAGQLTMSSGSVLEMARDDRFSSVTVRPGQFPS